MIPRLVLIALLLVSLAPSATIAQTGEPSRSFAWDVSRAVLIDPTTYAPAVISYHATRWDWRTSQVFFANGWVEENPRFTVSGKPADVPVSYDEGSRRILRTALTLVGYSAVNNAAAGVAERLLLARYPRRKTLIRTLSWAERIAFAAVLTYRNSADHLRQATDNRRLARELGYVR